ncbi:uncharacterized protein DUF1453 [Novosphingobium sp. PhB165]|uniref:CcdC protein domain-containing protein n=1 Tax=Novosphingobium sp. PhB165 TaxID=2485105 RepID=UPI0010E0D5A7|nr:CcdC protein domain-containing protein [Novosphingobium sp. PhB165]TCM21896.1 uncharacterized protein DUF1453 [Novosphingobium sp. PhB165]
MAAWLPLLVFAGLMLWRFRNLEKARPLRLPLLWILPLIITALVCFALFALPPSGLGWLSLAAGATIGGAIGMQRSRLMRLHVEGEGDDARVMVRQSPLALVLICGVFIVRRLLLPGGMAIGASHPAATALLLTDAMLGLVLGMVVVSRGVLWQRARAMVTNHITDA